MNPTKDRPKKYMSIEEVNNNLRIAKEGRLAKLNCIDGNYNIFIISVDWEKRTLSYALANNVYRDLKIKSHTVKIKRIKAIKLY